MEMLSLSEDSTLLASDRKLSALFEGVLGAF
jgi:hypothetical protein